MNASDPRAAAMTAYLLGTLPEDEAARLEQEYLADDEAFELLTALEEELLHEYAQGRLPADQRQRVEERLLGAPDGRARLGRAAALLSALSRRRAQRRQTLWAGGLAAAALLAMGLGWLLWRTPPPDRQAGLESPRPASPTPGPELQAPLRFVLALAPGRVRSAGRLQSASLPESADVLALKLTVPAAAAPGRWRAVVRSAEGREVWSREGAAADWPREGLELALDVPARLLPEDDYELTLSGDGQELADYAFRVLRAGPPRP